MLRTGGCRGRRTGPAGGCRRRHRAVARVGSLPQRAALGNGVDPILKERAFGLTGSQGNHGEDAKDYWWYLDSTPTHSWMSWRYHYPQKAFPYDDLVATNAARG